MNEKKLHDNGHILFIKRRYSICSPLLLLKKNVPERPIPVEYSIVAAIVLFANFAIAPFFQRARPQRTHVIDNARALIKHNNVMNGIAIQEFATIVESIV